MEQDWPEACCIGFSVAATIAGDRSAAHAAVGLTSSAAASLCAQPAALAALTKRERRARVQQLVEVLARSLALQAAEAPALDAMRLRAGFLPSAALRRVLARGARGEQSA